MEKLPTEPAWIVEARHWIFTHGTASLRTAWTAQGPRGVAPRYIHERLRAEAPAHWAMGFRAYVGKVEPLFGATAEELAAAVAAAHLPAPGGAPNTRLSFLVASRQRALTVTLWDGVHVARPLLPAWTAPGEEPPLRTVNRLLSMLQAYLDTTRGLVVSPYREELEKMIPDAMREALWAAEDSAMALAARSA